MKEQQMSEHSKIIYAGEWVRVRNFMNKRFHAAAPCSMCRRLSCSVVWYSVKTGEVRCLGCFDAEAGDLKMRYRRRR
jgi:Zn ribbon nucleic-acid-binding protein